MPKPIARLAQASRFRAALLATVLIGLGLLPSGCATLRNRSVTIPLVPINSDPAGADVFLGDKRIGITPTAVRPRRLGPTVVRVEKAGFVPQKVTIGRAANPWLLGNLMFANPLGCQGLTSDQSCSVAILSSLGTVFGIDLLTGAAYRYVAPPRVLLEPAVSASAQPTGATAAYTGKKTVTSFSRREPGR